MMPDAATSLAAPVSNKAVTFARRLSSTLLLWGAVVAVVVTGNRWMFFALMAVFGGTALVEWRRMVGTALSGAWAVWLYAVAGGYALSLLLVPGAALTPGLSEALAFPVLLLGLFALAMRRDLEGRETLWRIFSAAFGFIYIPVMLSFLWRLLHFRAGSGGGDAGVVPAGELSGVFYALFVVAVTKMTDTGAYFFGMLLGRHKMIPHISPGKTWEGLAGGMVGAFAASHGMVALWPEKLSLLDHRHAAVLAAGLAVATVVADLAESVIKRCLGVKDSGRLLPGIGGALDLVDSLLLTAPLTWVYLECLAR